MITLAQPSSNLAGLFSRTLKSLLPQSNPMEFERGFTKPVTSMDCTPLKGDQVAIVGRNRRVLDCLVDQIRAFGGEVHLFNSPDHLLSAMAMDHQVFDICLMIQDDFSKRDYSVLDVAVRTKCLSSFAQVFGLSALLPTDDLTQSKSQIIDGMIRLPASPFTILRALC
jgi:hypothetical protein